MQSIFGSQRSLKSALVLACALLLIGDVATRAAAPDDAPPATPTSTEKKSSEKSPPTETNAERAARLKDEAEKLLAEAAKADVEARKEAAAAEEAKKVRETEEREKRIAEAQQAADEARATAEAARQTAEKLQADADAKAAEAQKFLDSATSDSTTAESGTTATAAPPAGETDKQPPTDGAGKVKDTASENKETEPQPAAQAFVAQPGMSTNERLRLAAAWTNQAAAVQITGEPAVSVAFIKDKLGITADPVPRAGSVAKEDDQALASAALLSNAMTSVANLIQPATPTEEAVRAWSAAKAGFLAPMDTAAIPGISPGLLKNRKKNAWEQFLNDWELEALKSGRFRDALLQAPVIISGILLGFEQQHIEAAFVKGQASASQSGGGALGSGGAVMMRPTHMANHHLRAMNRIVERHSRRMRRIGYY